MAHSKNFLVILSTDKETDNQPILKVEVYSKYSASNLREI